MQANSLTIDRRSGLSAREFIEEYAKPMRPVVLTDAAARWPAMSKWTPEFFKREYGSLMVNLEGTRVSLGEVLDRAEHSTPDAPATYLRLLKLEDHLRELIPDVGDWPGRGPDRLRNPLIFHNGYLRNGSPELLIAGVGSSFPVLHYDQYSMHAFVTQLRGDKRFRLFPREQTPLLYPKPGNRFASAIDRFDPVDLQRFPLYAQARPLDVVVKQGETIFVPSQWWHVTTILSFSIAITINSVTRSNWQRFAHDKSYMGEKPDPIRCGAKYAYLMALGAGMSLRESLGV